MTTENINEDLVSVIMPAYNSSGYINQSIDSVIAQTYKNWELIIIDDCSTDNTIQVAEKYANQDSRITILRLDKNYGMPAHPRNKGIEASKGAWLAMLDSDDIWHPRKLDFQMKCLIDSRQQFCSTVMNDFTDPKEIHHQDPGSPKTETITFWRQLRRYRTPTSSVVLRKELLIKFPFNEDPRFRGREDFDNWLRIHEYIGQSIKLLFPFMYYRVSAGQISGSKIEMVRRTLFVLKSYRFLDGTSLGWRAYMYLGSHVIYSVYLRMLKKTL